MSGADLMTAPRRLAWLLWWRISPRRIRQAPVARWLQNPREHEATICRLRAELRIAERLLVEHQAADLIVGVLCGEYGIDRDYLFDVVETDRSMAAVINQLCEDQVADVRAGGIVLADAVRVVIRDGATPASMEQLADALTTYRWFIGEGGQPAAASGYGQPNDARGTGELPTVGLNADTVTDRERS